MHISLAFLLNILVILVCDNQSTPDKPDIHKTKISYTSIQDKIDNEHLTPELIIVPAGSNALGDISHTDTENEKKLI